MASMRSLERICADLAEIQLDATYEADWLRLDALVVELASTERVGLAVGPLLDVFERFARHDGRGVLWAIVHALESVTGYEQALIESVRRCPTDFNVLMIHRIINAGITRIGDIDLVELHATAEPLVPPIDYYRSPGRAGG